MNIQDIYESFFDTYRNMGYIISELSQRTLRRAANVALNATEGPVVKHPDAKDNLAMNLNKEKLGAQAARFARAADKKAKKSEGSPRVPGMDPEIKAKMDSRDRRAKMVNKSLKDTEGFANEKDRQTAVSKAANDSRDVKRLRKRFKGELDG
jgi:hypothetical protein